MFLFLQVNYADNNKILIIGLDGVTSPLLDYAFVPNIGGLIENATYNLESFSTYPAFTSSGWSTMLTGVSPEKHGVVQDDSFADNHFDTYPSIVTRVKEQLPNASIMSIVRDQRINEFLNFKADHKFNYATDEQVTKKAVELLGATDFKLGFVQFSEAKEAGEKSGFLLREAEYIIAIQKIDNYVGQLLSAISARANYRSENWAIYIVSTHGGYLAGAQAGYTKNEVHVPIIFSGKGYENKVYNAAILAPARDNDNILGIVKKSGTPRTYVRIPIVGTPLQGMDKYTIEMWIKPNSDNSSDPSIMGDKNWDSGGNGGFIICRSGGGWKINFADETRTRYDIGGRRIEDGKWHHIAITFDKTNECVIYQDGEEVNRVKLSYKSHNTMISPYDYICLAQEGTQTYGGGYHWSGSFNEVRIWTEVLSYEVIVKYMNARNIEKSDHPFLSHLNLYLKMDEVVGNTAYDSSGKNHHGEIMGPNSYRHPFYALKLTDVSTNILTHLRLQAEEEWGLEGTKLAVDLPYRLFKVNK